MNKTKAIDMTVFKALSVENENKGKWLGCSKRNEVENGKLKTFFETREEFEQRMKLSTVWTFEIVEC